MGIEMALPELLEAGPFDMFLTDMNLPFDKAIERMQTLASLLKNGGLLVFTLKCVGFCKKEAVLDLQAQRLVEALSSSFECFGIYWLWSNSLRERTIVAKKSPVHVSVLGV